MERVFFMRINDKANAKMASNTFGFQIRDSSDEWENVEFASEFGVTGSEITKVQKKVNRE